MTLVAHPRAGGCLIAVTLAVLAGALAPPSSGQCVPALDPRYWHAPINGTPKTSLIWDDGTGPALYLAGWFTTAGNVACNHIARWDGVTWSALGTGTSGVIECLAAFDDGAGPALYAGGSFGTAGGVPVTNVARWNGQAWAAVGTGLTGIVTALEVFDGGGGATLHAGGSFTIAFGAAANYVARWNGATWNPVGGGTNGPVYALKNVVDATGAGLYAGGNFSAAGGAPAAAVARWNGSNWAPLGSGLSNFFGTPLVNALAIYNDGAGEALFVGGLFDFAGGLPSPALARWSGTSWSSPGPATIASGYVTALEVHDAGAGLGLYAGGEFTFTGSAAFTYIARWDGAVWSGLGAGIDPFPGASAAVLTIRSLTTGPGAGLYAGGAFPGAGGIFSPTLVRWASGSWQGLPVGRGTDGPVSTLAVWPGGPGSLLVAGGGFRNAGTAAAQFIGSFDGAAWAPLGSGIDGPITDLAVFDDGAGPKLVAAGSFTTAGGVPAANIAAWDGVSWSAVGGGTDGTVNALVVHDAGAGPALYAAGGFGAAGGVPVAGFARWNGTSWTAVGLGVAGGPYGGPAWIADLAVFDPGTGQRLYVAGGFSSAGGVAAANIASFDGLAWSPLGAGLDANPQVLAVHDDGAGPVLVAGGQFTTAGGLPAAGIARWSGSGWNSFGAGFAGNPFPAWIGSIVSFHDGTGPGLCVGGDFAVAGGAPALRIARWNGSAWSGLGGGADGRVDALAVFDDGTGADLFLGGLFGVLDGRGSSGFGRWRSARAASVAILGAGCGGGVPPISLGSTAPILGLALTLSVANAAPLRPGLFAASLRPPLGLSLGGACTLFTDLADPLAILPLNTDAAGAWSLGLSLPSECDLEGVAIIAQAAVFGTAGPLGLDLSNGVRLVFGR